MQQSKYEKYIAAEFLEDSFFIEWVRDNTPPSRQFWNRWEESSPANLEEMRAAKAELLMILSAQRIFPLAEDEEEVWNRIVETIEQQDDRAGASTKVTARVVRMNLKPWAVAASVLLIISIGYFISIKKNIPVLAEVVPEKIVENDLMPGGNKAILTLGDGQRILLDSLEKGNLANQGNTSIVKLEEGRIAYKNTHEKPADIVYNTISTPRGGQYQVELADGSKAWLNAASSLRFPTQFQGGERKVEITGEVYFEIAKCKGITFEVHLGNGAKVQVLGTHFNVKDFADERSVEATLLEGSVKFTEKEKNVILRPGQQVVLNESTTELTVNNQVDMEEVMAWKNGKFYFKNSDIESVMKQISRWYDVDVEYRGKIDKRFEGSVSRDISASNIFKILEATGGVNFKIDGKKIMVSP